MGFFASFFNVVEGDRETAVLCPFPHHTLTGVEYLETHPSAHLNLEKNVFHCKVCNKGYSEASFIQELFGCSYLDAIKISHAFEQAPDAYAWHGELTDAGKVELSELGISETTATELNLNTRDDGTIEFPVQMYGKTVDVRAYKRGGSPKVRSQAGALSGYIIPFDQWQQSPQNKITLICAGEKDMAVARSHGFNAITFTGGEHPPLRLIKLFRGRSVVIVYDNDDAGKDGAKYLASALLPYAKNVKVCTAFHEICKENREDITDFFTKYGKTREDLIAYIKATPYFKEEDAIRVRNAEPIKNVTLYQAAQPENIGKILQANIQVVATADQTFLAPTSVVATKMRLSGDPIGDTLNVGEQRTWELKEDTLDGLFKLIDNNLTDAKISENLRMLMGIPPKERCMPAKVLSHQTVFKCQVTDMLETRDRKAEIQLIEFSAYCIGCKLESGQKYNIRFKICPHPLKGGQLYMLITGATVANDSVSDFKLDQRAKDNLRAFKDLPGDVAKKVEENVNRVKGLVGFDGNEQLIKTIDLAYHTPLMFNFRHFKDVRAYLDTFIVGESRVGKSSTAEKLRETYGLGMFTSLAGNSATIAGLVGGSNKTASGAFQTRAGVIPQNHKGLIIFEEFGKSNANIIKELTDIRSSNEVRIVRVSGTLTLPALVRMITLSNPKTVNGTIKAIDAYPNGMSVLLDLIDTAEDIARYDMILILGDKGATEIDPMWVPPTPFTQEQYQTRVRWVWSRTPEQIKISPAIENYIIERSNYLNKTYGGHIKLFGTETWKKLSRLAIAVAGYVVSCDASYENIIVDREHVDYAERVLIELYDNSTFKLKEYIESERRYSETDAEAVQFLKDIALKNPAVVQYLEMNASTTRNSLAAVAGLGSDAINSVVNLLVRGYFVRINETTIVPTERFRLTLKQIRLDQLRVRRLGE